MKKQLGCTWIEVKDNLHAFLVNDQECTQMIGTHAALKILSRQMHDMGYVVCSRYEVCTA